MTIVRVRYTWLSDKFLVCLCFARSIKINYEESYLTVESLLHSIVNNGYPCSLNEVYIITKEVRNVPLLTILISIFKRDFESII